MTSTFSSRPYPPAQGLYDPADERDACGVGFVAHLRAERSRSIVQGALDLLVNLSHRSATGGDAETGDGAGILLQLPHTFFRRVCHAERIPLPEAGGYGVAMLFLPRSSRIRQQVETLIDATVHAHAGRVLGWRDVPVRDERLAPAAREAMPAIRQLFIASAALDGEPSDPSGFERALYLMRRAIERATRQADCDGNSPCYVASLSSRTIVYKGLLRPDQLQSFYCDLGDESVESGIAMVHSRFSTNTFPSWPLAHPYRFLCHNGEINTVRGNIRWMLVREEQMASDRLGTLADDVFPLIQPGQSDSASLDNVVELLVHSGRPLAQAMMMLIPDAWERDAEMPPDHRAFYDYHASVMEPWDGPAAVTFTDGRIIGAIQDRNGLRPARWIETEDDLVILSSEAGALTVAPERIRKSGRLQPGKLLLVNTTQGRVLDDGVAKSELASIRPYRRWVHEARLDLDELTRDVTAVPNEQALSTRQRMFGITREDQQGILGPMAASAEEPHGSMGNDTPLAVMSDRPQLLFAYFRQLFAQVTNPAIDPIREQRVMSLTTYLGPLGNLLDESTEHARQIRVAHPVLTAAGIAALRGVTRHGLRATTLPICFPASQGASALEAAIDDLCTQAVAAIEHGYGTLILSDRTAAAGWAPIPSLFAVSAIHHHLIRTGKRSRISLVVEAGDAREVSHVALLFSYGAAAVHPYLALETCAATARAGRLGQGDAEANYIKALEKGLLKILSKMGISTLQSYCGAQTWEAVGLDRALVDRHFAGTSSRIGGIDLAIVAEEVLRRHSSALAADEHQLLDAGGEYHYRARGEHHNWNPRTIATLQHAARTGSASTYREFATLVDDAQRGDATLRSMLEFAEREPVPLEEVEPAAEIVRRFVTGAMSFGSISAEAHETLAVAMNQMGARSNTGEGGEDPARFGTDRNSAIKQVASARFGVTAEYLVSAKELQIKIAQGAKPGEGGQLPGHKVDEVIARTRHSTPGVTLISPPPHHDIYSIEDLKQLIYDLRCVNPSATVSVKLVAEAGVGVVAAGVAKADADLITISGDSGGTGASPLSSIKNAGVPWELGLAEAQQTLSLNGLRSHVRLQVDGQLKTGRDVVIAALLGADEFGFATAPLIVEGCVMMRKCHLNTCPVGIATQDPVLREKFTGRPEHLVNYFFFVAEDARALMARLGFRRVDEMVGRTDVLRARPRSEHWKAKTLDLSALLHSTTSVARTERRKNAPPTSLDHELLPLLVPALDRREPVRVARPIRNVHRTVGATISGEIARRYGGAGLAPDTITLRFDGSAGQSFGAFATNGLTLELEGEANDYVGKGLSGGRLVLYPHKTARVFAEDSVIVGNTALYGATSGEAFIAGAAGERFAVRNSGATAVVEGVGDHGCEYMTGGTVVVLGSVGRNFAAGMSGGVAFVIDPSDSIHRRISSPLVEVSAIADADDQARLRRLIERHARQTGSRRARRALAHWNDTLRNCLRVMPLEYKHALQRQTERDAKASATEARYG